MTRTEKETAKLVALGWRLLRIRHYGCSRIQYWTHPNHQPDRNGFFTRQTALDHQRMLDKNGGVCDCIKENA